MGVNLEFKKDPIMILKDVKKSFGKVEALKGVNLRILEGKVMGILGENGAGKSTLMNILSGVIQKTSGQLILNDKEISFKNIKEAEKNGITIIHQEILAFPDMTVLDNIFCGHEIKNKLGFLNYKKEKEVVKKILKNLKLNLSYNELLGNLTIAQQQMVEIAKAIYKQSKIIIMDEPTSSLSRRESTVLFEIIENLKKEGKAILYISHRLEEIPVVCDFITIIRDGEYIGEYKVNEIKEEEIISKMVGREVGQKFPDKKFSTIGSTVLRVKNLSNEFVSNINFELKKGEILGFSGLVGAKRTELFKTIIGLFSKDEGEIEFLNKETNFKNPSQAINKGFYYVTEDRKNEGLHLDETINKNISLSSLKNFSVLGFLKFKSEKINSNNFFKKMRIKATDINVIVKNMSGGNQQKVLIAKAFSAEPKIVVFDEPTRGIDVGARREIYDLIVELKNKGVAVIVISSDLPEIVGLCNRVIVMKDGKIASNIEKDISPENVIQYAI